MIYLFNNGLIFHIKSTGSARKRESVITFDTDIFLVEYSIG